MPENVEIKARAHDFDRQRSLAALLCGQAGEKILQRDTFYNVPQGRLKLREFGDGSGELIYYLRPDERQAKLSDYMLSTVNAPDTLNAVLCKALGVWAKFANSAAFIYTDRPVFILTASMSGESLSNWKL